jgi:hypothetical protein
MRSSRVTLIAISISLICVLSIGLVSALNPDEATALVSWASPTYYSGDTLVFRIFFQSNSNDDLLIQRIGLHFEWMPEGAFYSHDLSAAPVSIPSNGSYTFDIMSAEISSNVTAGLYSYFVGVDGLQNNISFSWDSPPATIQIHDGRERGYNELLPQVESKLAEANNATYGSPEARSLLQQARDEFEQAESSASEEKWYDATSHLQDASTLLDQAAEAEENSAGQPNWLLIAAITAIGVIIAVSILVVVRRKRVKAKPAGSAPEQPVEPSL